MCTPPGLGNWCSNLPSNRRGQSREWHLCRGHWKVKVWSRSHTALSDYHTRKLRDPLTSTACPVLWEAPMVVNAATSPIKHFPTSLKLLSCPSMEFSNLSLTGLAGKTPKAFYNIYKNMIPNWIMLSKSSISTLWTIFFSVGKEGRIVSGLDMVQATSEYNPVEGRRRCWEDVD